MADFMMAEYREIVNTTVKLWSNASKALDWAEAETQRSRDELRSEYFKIAARKINHRVLWYTHIRKQIN
ncbi:hypothetical protein QT972_09705 [Microcoleus sp. herbarium7]